MGKRRDQLGVWVKARCVERGVALAGDWTLAPVSGDASFRRYFRVRHGEQSWIAVDAPPDKEDSAPFVAIARSWLLAGVRVPEVLVADLQQGFMLLSDLGDQLYLPLLDDVRADALYDSAMRALLTIQQTPAVKDWPLPPYDEPLLQREMALFKDWFVVQLLGLTLSKSEEALIQTHFDQLAAAALSQPVCPVHRDYHSRNLMWLDGGAPGVLDFQDAVQGPVTYDLVSLLRDCYVAWPRGQVERWALGYRDRAVAEGIMPPVGDIEFIGWFDRMGMQRHLKAIGIFARLKLRDGKSGYLADIPRTLNYLISVGARQAELQEFVAWLQNRVVSAMEVSGYFASPEPRVSA